MIKNSIFFALGVLATQLLWGGASYGNASGEDISSKSYSAMVVSKVFGTCNAKIASGMTYNKFTFKLLASNKPSLDGLTVETPIENGEETYTESIIWHVRLVELNDTSLSFSLDSFFIMPGPGSDVPFSLRGEFRPDSQGMTYIHQLTVKVCNPHAPQTCQEVPDAVEFLNQRYDCTFGEFPAVGL